MPRLAIAAADEVLDLYYPALDHGFVALVDYMGGDHASDRAARVSFGPQARAVSDTRTLARMLRRHEHTTPTEMTEVVFHMGLPIFVARQLVRHRTASLNEQSARYSVLDLAFYTPARDDLRPQSKANKQGRAGEPVDAAAYESYVRSWGDGREHATRTYHDLLAADVARELARIDLPLSTYTQWYLKIDLHNLFRLLTLRVDAHAQKETRVYANLMAALARRVAPLAYEAWVDYTVCGVRFGRAEREALLVWGRGKHSAREAGAACGLEDRELAEFVAKLAPPVAPDFAVDPAQGVAGEVFRERYRRLNREALDAARVPSGAVPEGPSGA